MKLKDLEIGSVVKDSANSLTFLVAAQDHPGYGGTALFARKIVELGCRAGAEYHAFSPYSVVCGSS